MVEGDGAPVEQVMVVGVHLDGAEIGHVNACVAGVIDGERLGIDAVVLELLQRPSEEAEQRARQVADEFQDVVHPDAGLVRTHLGDEFLDIGMDLFHRGLPFRPEDELCHRLLRVVGELALDVEGDLDVLPFIIMAAGDEIVHLGAQEHRLGQGRGNEMEPGIFEFGMVRVLFRKVLVHFGQVHHLAEHGFVVSPVAEHVRHHHMHRIQSAEAVGIPPVTPALFFLWHFGLRFQLQTPKLLIFLEKAAFPARFPRFRQDHPPSGTRPGSSCSGRSRLRSPLCPHTYTSTRRGCPRHHAPVRNAPYRRMK